MINWIMGLLFLVIFLPVSAQLHSDGKRFIFDKETSVLFDPFSDSSLPRFTPSLAEIDSADKYLVTQLTRDTPADRNPPALNLYYRQYVGFFRDGRKYIFINAACNKSEYFTENTWYPRGGGNCYFRAWIDLEQQKVEKLLFNAPK